MAVDNTSISKPSFRLPLEQREVKLKIDSANNSVQHKVIDNHANIFRNILRFTNQNIF
jgi:hypothetical protein